MEISASTRGGFSRRDIAYFLFKRKNQILVVFAVSLVAVTSLAYVSPRVYEAFSTVFVVRSLPPTTTPNSYHVILDRKEVLNSEVDFIRSRAVAERVATSLLSQEALYPSSAPQSRSILARVRGAVDELLLAIGLIDRGDEGREDLIAGLQSSIRAEPALDSNIITIAFRAEEPKFAAAIVNAVTEAYLEERLALVKQPGLNEFYAHQLDRSRAVLEDLESQARELRTRAGVVDTAEEIRLKLEQLSQLDYDLAGARSDSGELAQRVATLKAQLDVQPRTITVSRTIQRNPAIDDLEKKRLDLEAEKATELNRFKPGSAPIQDLERSIKRIEEAISQEPETIVISESVANNSIFDELQTELYRAEAEHAAKRARETTLTARVVALRTELAELGAHAAELDPLSASIASADRIYRGYIEQGEDARVANQTDTGTTNVHVIHYAAVPTKPLRSRMKLITMGAMLGLFAGFGLAFVSELFDHSLDSRADVESYVGLPVLASLPESKELTRPL